MSAKFFFVLNIAIASVDYFTKGIKKKTCSACIVELYKHLGVLTTLEKPTICSSLSAAFVFLKIPVCL